MAGRPKRTEAVTSLLLRLPQALLWKLDRCKAVLELREGGSLTRTSVLARALDVGADILMGKDEHPWQTHMVPTIGGQTTEGQHKSLRQPIPEHEETETVPQEAREEAGEDTPQTGNTLPDYDTNKYTLGKLCPRGHEYHGTGKTLLRLPGYRCLQCEAEHKRTKRQAKRQAQPA